MHLTELRLQTHALPALIPFYRDVLGLPLHEASADSPAFQAGETRLVFAQVDDGSKPLYHFAFNIPENRFDEAMTWARQRFDVLPMGDQGRVHHEAWNAHALYFLDPAENILEFIARHNLPNASDTPFGRDSLINISEIGLPVPDVSAMVDALAREVGLPLWRGGGDVFAAVGDEHGLCIVSVVGRFWLGTEVPAAVYPAALTLRGDRARTVTLPGLPYRFAITA